MCAYTLVTAITYFGLGGSFHYQTGTVDCVTVGTCHVIAFVGAGSPVQQRTVPVTVDTYSIADCGRRHIVTVKRNQWPGIRFIFDHELDVRFTRTMAGFTFNPVVDMLGIIFVAIGAGVRFHIFTTGFNKGLE